MKSDHRGGRWVTRGSTEGRGTTIASAGVALVTAIALGACARVPPKPCNPALIQQSQTHFQHGQVLAQNGHLDGALHQLELAAERLWEAELALGDGEPWPRVADSLAGAVLAQYSALLRELDEFPEETPAWLVAEEPTPAELAAPAPASHFDSSEYDIPIVVNERVERAIRYYCERARSPFTLWLSRSGHYVSMMQDILASYDLPKDLVWLALVESGFSPWAYSRAHAAGYWQFIRATAHRYGLRVTWWVDERRNPVKSTHAAARYLRDLHDGLGSWPLALAAYNCGEGRVRRRMRSERTSDFWALRRLPRQTAGFVPRYMAATIIANNPQAFGFHVRYDEPGQTETVTLDGPADLRITAECLGMEYEELKGLNPELTRWCTPPEDPWYDLQIPAGLTRRYLASLSSIRNSAPDTYIRHRVREGESLWRLSRFYHVPVATLAEVNELRNQDRIGIGQTIMVPMPASSTPRNKHDVSPRLGRDAKGRVTAVRSATATDARTTERRPWNGIRESKFPVLEKSLRIQPLEPHPSSGG